MKNKFNQPLNLLINNPWKIIVIFSILGLLAILNHSMWRDEMNTWLIVRDSDSFLDMVNNVNYQGHPLLWAISVSFWFNFVKNPVIMQLFHLFLGITALIIFWQYSPFNYRQKLLFSFGYLPFYEYLLIARPYAWGMLFLWVFCATFNTRKKTYLISAIVLGLMANSNAYALFVSSSLALMLLLEFCFDKKYREEYLKNAPKYDFFLSLFIIISLYLFSLYIMSPPPDSANHGGQDGFFFAFEAKRFLIVLAKLFSAYVFISSKTQWLDLIVCNLIGLAIFSVIAVNFIKKPLPLFFYIFGTFSLLTFTYCRFYIADFRHFGHCYLILITSFWLATYYEDSNFLAKKITINLNKQLNYKILMLILYLHFFAGIYGFTRDLIIPYSASRETAHYIKQEKLNDEFIIASEDSKMAALSGYLNRKFYYPELQKIGSFTLFIQQRQSMTQEKVLEQTIQILRDKQNLNKILLILNRELKTSNNQLNITPIKKFTNSFKTDEKHYLYWTKLND